MQRAFETLVAADDRPDELMLDNTWVKARRSAGGGKGGAHFNVIRHPRGGPTTKLRTLVNGLARLVAFTITSGQLSDAPVAVGLVTVLTASVTLATYRAYDSDPLCQLLIARGTTPLSTTDP